MRKIQTNYVTMKKNDDLRNFLLGNVENNIKFGTYQASLPKSVKKTENLI